MIKLTDQNTKRVKKNILGSTVVLIGNNYRDADQFCSWDTWLTVNGFVVLTPSNLPPKPSREKVALSDFVHQRRIDRGDAVLIITGPNAEIDAFMIPQIMYSFTQGKIVLCDRHLGNEEDMDLQKIVLESEEVLTTCVLFQVSWEDLAKAIMRTAAPLMLAQDSESEKTRNIGADPSYVASQDEGESSSSSEGEGDNQATHDDSGTTKPKSNGAKSRPTA